MSDISKRFIHGEEHAGSAAALDVLNPATNETIHQAANASAQDARQAIESAAEAQQT